MKKSLPEQKQMPNRGELVRRIGNRFGETKGVVTSLTLTHVRVHWQTGVNTSLSIGRLRRDEQGWWVRE